MKHVIPFGDRILVKRKKVGEKIKAESIVLPDSVTERDTDLAEVIYVPELTFADKNLIENSEQIIDSLLDKAKQGDSGAFEQVLIFNHYLKIKHLKAGDEIFMGKYVGTNFYDTNAKCELTMVSESNNSGS